MLRVISTFPPEQSMLNGCITTEYPGGILNCDGRSSSLILISSLTLSVTLTQGIVFLLGGWPTRFTSFDGAEKYSKHFGTQEPHWPFNGLHLLPHTDSVPSAHVSFVSLH